MKKLVLFIGLLMLLCNTAQAQAQTSAASEAMVSLYYSKNSEIRITAMFLGVYLADEDKLHTALKEVKKHTSDPIELTVINYALARFDFLNENESKLRFLESFPDDKINFDILLATESKILRGPPNETIGFFYDTVAQEAYREKFRSKILRVNQLVQNNAAVADAMRKRIKLLTEKLKGVR